MTNIKEDGGYIYLMQNPNNLNEIKIGLSQDPIQRRNQLHNTSTSKPMDICRVWATNSMKESEAIAHEAMKGHRVSDNRELFNLSVDPSELETPHQTEGHELSECYIQSVSEHIEECWEIVGVDCWPTEIKSLVEKKQFEKFTSKKTSSF